MDELQLAEIYTRVPTRLHCDFKGTRSAWAWLRCVDAVSNNTAIQSVSFGASGWRGHEGLAFSNELFEIATWLKKLTLRTVSFEHSAFDRKHLRLFLSAIKHQPLLERINLNGVNVGDSLVASLIKSWKTPQSLREIHLKNTLIGDKTLAALLESAPYLKSIEVLDLSLNRFSLDGGEQLAALITGFTHLKRLNLTGIKLTDVAAMEIARALINHPEMVSVAIEKCQLSMLGARWFEYAFYKNSRLIRVRLDNTQAHKKETAAIKKLCNVRQTGREEDEDAINFKYWFKSYYVVSVIMGIAVLCMALNAHLLIPISMVLGIVTASLFYFVLKYASSPHPVALETQEIEPYFDVQKPSRPGSILHFYQRYPKKMVKTKETRTKGLSGEVGAEKELSLIKASENESMTQIKESVNHQKA